MPAVVLESVTSLGADSIGTPASDSDDLLPRLEQLGALHYHHKHPFNLLMHAGRLDREDLRLWVANRYYYQTRIPIKDALIVSKSEDESFRRVWIQRLLDHDGRGDPRGGGELGEAPPGGLALWRSLGAALGLESAQLESGSELLPDVRRACDDYVELVRGADLVTAVASSLTEYFAGTLMQVRIDAWVEHYPYIPKGALGYFEQRVTRAREDARYALQFVQQNAKTEAQKELCLQAFQRKCAILWRLLDAVYIKRRLGSAPRLENRAWLMKLPAHSSDENGRLHGPAVLLVPEKALQLNRTAFALIERCDGKTTLGHITGELALEHGVSRQTVELDVASFVGELERRRILVFGRRAG